MAAASALVSIEKTFLECSICCGPFDDPRALPCLHPFCCGCLENWAKTCSKNGKIVSCPLCRKVYRIPEDDGIKGFPAHFLVANLQTKVDKARQTASVADTCDIHGEKKAFFCETCGCAACAECAVLDTSHKGHAFIRLKEAVHQQTKSLKDLARRIADSEEKFATALQQTQQIKLDLDRSGKAKIRVIDDARKEHMQYVDNVVEEYKQEVHRLRKESRQPR